MFFPLNYSIIFFVWLVSFQPASALYKASIHTEEHVEQIWQILVDELFNM